MEEEDNEIPGLVWLYLESEYGDENSEYEPKYNIHYAKITNNAENLLVWQKKTLYAFSIQGYIF